MIDITNIFLPLDLLNAEDPVVAGNTSKILCSFFFGDSGTSVEVFETFRSKILN